MKFPVCLAKLTSKIDAPRNLSKGNFTSIHFPSVFFHFQIFPRVFEHIVYILGMGKSSAMKQTQTCQWSDGLNLLKELAGFGPRLQAPALRQPKTEMSKRSLGDPCPSGDASLHHLLRNCCPSASVRTFITTIRRGIVPCPICFRARLGHD